MKRGDLVTVALAGDYGKPRPALVIQDDAYSEHPSVTILPLSSTIVEMGSLRVLVHPGEQTGLRRPSQVMVDKAATLPRAKVGPTFGRLPPEALMSVDRALTTFLGLA